MLYVVNKRRSEESIRKEFPNAFILDLTSTAKSYARILSPFYPHGGIPIPGDSRGMTAMSVEGIWQGLKVFNSCDVDLSSFTNDTMKGLKRTVRKYGLPQGHRYGVYSDKLLDYFTARMLIYLPSYKYVLDNVPEVQRIIQKIKQKAEKEVIILLDYNTNTDYRDCSKPLSHAQLVTMYINGTYPTYNPLERPLTDVEIQEKKVKDKLLRKEVEDMSMDVPSLF